MAWGELNRRRRLRRMWALQDLMPVGQLVTSSQLAQVLNTSNRSIYRYIDELRASGIRIDGEAGAGFMRREGHEATYYGA